MKNKHLVLMFLLVLVGARWLRHLPIATLSRFPKEIVQILPHEIRSMEWVQHPQSDTLFLAKNDEKWLISEGTRSTTTTDTNIQALLHAFVSLRTVGILKTKSTTPPVLTPQLTIKVVKTDGSRRHLHYLEHQHQHCLQLDSDPLLFLLDAPPPAVFHAKFDALRLRQVLHLSASVQSIWLSFRTLPPLFFEKREEDWVSPGAQKRLPHSAVAPFLDRLKNLGNLPFADDFDETQAEDVLLGSIRISFADSPEPLKLTFYQSKNEQVWVLHSSQNTENQFFIPKNVGEALLYFPAFLQ